MIRDALLAALAAVAPLAGAPAASPASPASTRAAEADPREAYDVLSYELFLEVEPDDRALSGSVAVLARVVADELDRLVLDLVDGMEVLGVSSRGVALEFTHEADALTCVLSRVRRRGEEVLVTVRYRGSPRAQDSFSGFHWAETDDGRPWINTSCQGPGAHSWWPCKASYFHPEDKPERVAMDVSVPAGLVAVSNGRLVATEELEGDRRVFRWRHDYPLETYSVTLNVGPYVAVHDELEVPGHEHPVPFSYWVLPASVEKAEVQFAEVEELVRIYSEAFGPFPFPRSKIGLVETNFWGMEHSSAIAYGSSYPAWCRANDEPDPHASRNRYYDYILVHEMAHEWWGNSVSAEDWGHFWIHEGLGTYAEGVYLERTQGRERADELFGLFSSHVGATSRLYRGDDVDSGEAYAGIVYSKGACVLNTLRHRIDDDEAWWRSLREFHARHRYGNADTEDFRAVVEEVTGEDLEAFFESWVYGEGYPVLTGRVLVRDGGIELELRNASSSTTTFDVPLDLRWTAGGEEHRERLVVPPGEYRHRVEVEGEPSDVRVDGLQRVLGRHEVKVQ